MVSVDQNVPCKVPAVEKDQHNHINTNEPVIFLACFPLQHASASMHERWWLYPNNHRISGASPPNAALQFRWKRAAQDLIVEPSRGWHLWKCYYFATKAAHFADHFNTPCHRELHFHASNHFVGTCAPFQMVNISLWNEAFQRKNSRYLLWLHLNVNQLQQLYDYSVTIHRLEKSLFPLLVLTPGHQTVGCVCVWGGISKYRLVSFCANVIREQHWQKIFWLWTSKFF